MRYKTDFDKHTWFKPPFAVGDYSFFEQSLFVASSANCIAYKGCSKLPPKRAELYHINSIEPAYARIDQESLRSTLLVNQLSSVAEEKRSNTKPTSDPRTSSDTNLVSGTLPENEKYYVRVLWNDPWLSLRGCVVPYYDLLTRVDVSPQLFFIDDHHSTHYGPLRSVAYHFLTYGKAGNIWHRIIALFFMTHSKA